uniref:CSTF2_hinge domain-containing protein n=1 Tax=Heterorhabditis bacteriophora TaxID=37862 RepID=A0A1I7W9U1_HETBA
MGKYFILVLGKNTLFIRSQPSSQFPLLPKVRMPNMASIRALDFDSTKLNESSSESDTKDAVTPVTNATSLLQSVQEKSSTSSAITGFSANSHEMVEAGWILKNICIGGILQEYSRKITFILLIYYTKINNNILVLMRMFTSIRSCGIILWKTKIGVVRCSVKKTWLFLWLTTEGRIRLIYLFKIFSMENGYGFGTKENCIYTGKISIMLSFKRLLFRVFTSADTSLFFCRSIFKKNISVFKLDIHGQDSSGDSTNSSKSSEGQQIPFVDQAPPGLSGPGMSAVQRMLTGPIPQPVADRIPIPPMYPHPVMVPVLFQTPHLP